MSTRHEEFTIGDHATVAITTKSGIVETRAGVGERVNVAIVGDNAEEWLVEQLGNTIAISPPERRHRRVRSVRILVEVPAGTDLDVSAASADVTLVGDLGSTKIRTASGNVRVDSVARFDVNTASGDARADAVASSAACNSASGDVDLGVVGGRLTVSTASGDVRVERAADDVQIGTASGDVRIHRFDGSSLGVKCMSGDVTVGLPAGIRVEPDIVTLSGRTTLPAPSPVELAAERRVVRVGLRTVSGDITIERVAI